MHKSLTWWIYHPCNHPLGSRYRTLPASKKFLCAPFQSKSPSKGNLYSKTVFFFLISYKWSHRRCTLLHLASFTQHHISEIHPGHANQLYVLLLLQKTIPQFIQPFYYKWTFLSVLLLQLRLLWIFCTCLLLDTGTHFSSQEQNYWITGYLSV